MTKTYEIDTRIVKAAYPIRNDDRWTGLRSDDPTRRMIRSAVRVLRLIKERNASGG